MTFSFTRSLRTAICDSGFFQLRCNPVEPLVDAVEVATRGNAEPSQRLFDGVVRHSFQVITPSYDLLANVGWNVQRSAHVVEQRLTAVVQHLSTSVNQSRRTPLFFGQDDLRERDLGQVMTVVPVDNFDVVSVTHELGDALQRDVSTRACVIELAICVLLDKVSFGGCRHGRGPF